jgi:hypothetical protein
MIFSLDVQWLGLDSSCCCLAKRGASYRGLTIAMQHITIYEAI